jgi:hypothetical protein
VFPHLPPPARGALSHAYRVGFVDALTTILLIAAGIALVGGLLAFVLVRPQDFVTSSATGQEEGAADAAPAGVPAG